ncbi:hypothetical protein HKD37_09G024276 [Glycine soja]|uniref:Uncharacterized protein n=1 Tax=Glycine max TaxID=3847 RepID=A0A0R0IAD0_SOYBN|nr:hypothetical protein GYH30_023871 [Glycine max]KAH1231797.1 hypothetical protein GmHk_09G024603 [Glycine max]
MLLIDWRIYNQRICRGDTSKKIRNSEGELLQDKEILSPYEAMNIREIGALNILQILHGFPRDGEDIF